ncbi:MAG: ORF6N domain-containing protein [Bacteroidetes bacterium]|nr:ORF6N domain-containing protein [Bacteroidota bacterium]
MESIIPAEIVTSKIFLIRKEKVIIDSDLAALYGVETKALVQAVKRNLERFPQDFMFQFTKDEFKILRSQIVASSWGGRRYPPFVFTEQGVAMLSSVLKSKRAVQVNTAIMRAFVQLRKFLESNDDLSRRLRKLEMETKKRYKEQKQQIQLIFDSINELMIEKEKPKNPIGFKVISD